MPEHYVGISIQPNEREVAQRPTPEEFFAVVTVDVATNLDEMAASKGRPRRRLDLTGVQKDKKHEEVPRAPGPGKGPREEDDAEPFNRKWLPEETVIALCDKDVDAYCMIGTDPPPGRAWPRRPSNRVW